MRLVHASGALVDVDAIKVITAATFLGEGKYDGDEPGLIYSTNWYTYAGPEPYASSLLFAFSPGESMQFSFTGEQLELTYTQMADRGVMDVYVDEVKVASIDESGTGAWQQTWTSEPLPAGNHNVRFVLASGGGVIDIDALQIISTSNVLGLQGHMTIRTQPGTSRPTGTPTPVQGLMGIRCAFPSTLRIVLW